MWMSKTKKKKKSKLEANLDYKLEDCDKITQL